MCAWVVELPRDGTSPHGLNSITRVASPKMAQPSTLYKHQPSNFFALALLYGKLCIDYVEI